VIATAPGISMAADPHSYGLVMVPVPREMGSLAQPGGRLTIAATRRDRPVG
jgi:hypothetical protein